jgi:hypothetical protein
MRLRKMLTLALGTFFLLGAAMAGLEANAQGSRGSLRQNYQGARTGSQLPFSSQGTSGRFGQTGGLGQSGIGQRGVGGRGGMMGADGGVQGQGALTQGPMTAGLAQTTNERFQEGGFVGRDAQDVQTSAQSLTGGRGPGMMMDMMIENLNEMREARRRWRDQNAAPPPIRVRLQPAFEMPARPAAQSAAAVGTRLTKAMQAGRVQSAQVQIAGGTAILRGVVANERDRLLVARLASLEPGVSRVENLVTVQAPAVQPPQ